MFLFTMVIPKFMFSNLPSLKLPQVQYYVSIKKYCLSKYNISIQKIKLV